MVKGLYLRAKPTECSPCIKLGKKIEAVKNVAFFQLSRCHAVNVSCNAAHFKIKSIKTLDLGELMSKQKIL